MEELKGTPATNVRKLTRLINITQNALHGKIVGAKKGHLIIIKRSLEKRPNSSLNMCL